MAEKGESREKEASKAHGLSELKLVRSGVQFKGAAD